MSIRETLDKLNQNYAFPKHMKDVKHFISSEMDLDVLHL